MKKIFFSVFAAILYSCQSGEGKTSENSGNSDDHKIIVAEVLHTTSYTYLRAKEGSAEKWFALPLTDVKAGDTYYYEESMEMQNFESKELNRIFEKIYFLEEISAQPLRKENNFQRNAGEKSHRHHDEPEEEHHEHSGMQHTAETGAGMVAEKKEIKIEPEKGAITIAQLFSAKKSYAGKIVKVKGKAVKFSSGILGKNWIHIQDGTEHERKFDLTITSDQNINVGEIAMFEGKISLNKDLGFGYFFEVIMEDAVLK